MNRLLLIIAFLFAATSTFAVIQTPAGEVNVRNGTIVVNNEKLYITLQYDGKLFVLHNEHIVASAGKNPGLFLSIYWDADAKTQLLGTKRLIIIDATGSQVHRSNVLDTGIDFQWDDNNYVIFEGDAMFFGIYSPKRMQFVYRDGVLEENKGPWCGPAKPEIYIEPTGKDPCFNVNGVEACREELEREKAARQAKQKRKSTTPATLR